MMENMQSVCLAEYLASPLFLEEIIKRKLPYQAIISDIAYSSSVSAIPLF